MTKPSLTQQLTEYFQKQPPEFVAQWFAETVVSDKQLKKQWQIKLLLASGKTSDYKKLLTQALPKKELLRTASLWRKVAEYFADAEVLFALAFEHLDLEDGSLTNEQQFTWLMQAFERLNFVLEGIDDSGGYRLVLVEQLSERLVRCFHQLDWPQEHKVDWLHEHQYKYDVFPYIPEQFDLPKALQAAFARQPNPAALASQAELSDKVSMALMARLNNGKKP